MIHLFANGTEGVAWENMWCDLCAKDDHDDCPIHTLLLCTSVIPDAITKQPEGEFHLPPLHLCAEFTPRPDGDPLSEMRSRVVAIVNVRRKAQP